MRLQALFLCADEKVERIIRRVLSDLEIAIEHCETPEDAIHKLTRERYEAVIVDCNSDQVAAKVLKSARAALRNKRAVAVAIVDSEKRLGSSFDLGAHFVLYKPISAERAKASFRAARALMKRERRHDLRIPVEIPVILHFNSGTGQLKTMTTDLSEGGMAIQLSMRPSAATPVSVSFTLPGTSTRIECDGEIAWENSSRQAGVRFRELSGAARGELRHWIDTNCAEPEVDDPPAPCTLTDLSQGACYTELAVPFPVRTKVTLSPSIPGVQLQVGGIVRVAHPEVGMGVEFARETPEQRQQVEALIRSLMNSGSPIPELLVQPEGFDISEAAPKQPTSTEDPLLHLFWTKAELPAAEFQHELQKQRGAHRQAAGVGA